MDNITNCPKCSKVFVKNTLSDICQACVKEADLHCELCIKYLREHRGITLKELSDRTEVSLAQIAKFIKEGRISIISHPQISYPCEVCGTDIREKNMCVSCLQKLRKDLSNAKEDEKRAFDQAEEQKKQDRMKAFKITDRLNDRLK